MRTRSCVLIWHLSPFKSVSVDGGWQTDWRTDWQTDWLTGSSSLGVLPGMCKVNSPLLGANMRLNAAGLCTWGILSLYRIKRPWTFHHPRLLLISCGNKFITCWEGTLEAPAQPPARADTTRSESGYSRADSLGFQRFLVFIWILFLLVQAASVVRVPLERNNHERRAAASEALPLRRRRRRRSATFQAEDVVVADASGRCYFATKELALITVKFISDEVVIYWFFYIYLPINS